jgi:hypothetical protein
MGFGPNVELYQGNLPTNLTEVWPGSSTRPSGNVEITLIHVCNTTAEPQTFRLCKDFDGTTFSAATAHWWDVPLAVGESFEFQAQGPGTGIPLGRSGALGAAASATGVTMTVIGAVAPIGQDKSQP